MALEIHAKRIVATTKDKARLKVLVDGAELSIGKETMKIIPPKTTALVVGVANLDWSQWLVKTPDFVPHQYGPEDCSNWQENNEWFRKDCAEEKAKFKKFPAPPKGPCNWYIRWFIGKRIKEVQVSIGNDPKFPSVWVLVPKN